MIHAGSDAGEEEARGVPGAPRNRLVVAATMVAGIAGGVFTALVVTGVLGTQFLGFRVLTVQSGSMAPAYERGDVIVVKPTNPLELKGGDPVVFRVESDALVVHRIVSVTRVDLNVTDSDSGDVSRSTGLQFRTKGDASQAVDAVPVDGTAVVGVPWFRIPDAGGTGVISLRGALFAIAALTAVTWLLWEARARSGRRRWKDEAT